MRKNNPLMDDDQCYFFFRFVRLSVQQQEIQTLKCRLVGQLPVAIFYLFKYTHSPYTHHIYTKRFKQQAPAVSNKNNNNNRTATAIRNRHQPHNWD